MVHPHNSDQSELMTTQLNTQCYRSRISDIICIYSLFTEKIYDCSSHFGTCNQSTTRKWGAKVTKNGTNDATWAGVGKHGFPLHCNSSRSTVFFKNCSISPVFTSRLPNKPRNTRFGSDVRLGVASNSILLHASDSLVMTMLQENAVMSDIRLARRSNSERLGKKSIGPT